MVLFCLCANTAIHLCDLVGQVEEETGLRLNIDDLVDLTAFLDPSTGNQVFPSPVREFYLSC